MQARTAAADFRYFADIRRVSTTFNSLFEPIVFRNARIRLPQHIPWIKEPSFRDARDTPDADKSQAQCSLDEVPCHLRLVRGWEKWGDESELHSVWRWVKRLTFSQFGRFPQNCDLTDGRLETLVRTIQGLSSIEDMS